MHIQEPPHCRLQGTMSSFSPRQEEPDEFWSPSAKTNKPAITADKTVNDVPGQEAIKATFYTGKADLS